MTDVGPDPSGPCAQNLTRRHPKRALLSNLGIPRPHTSGPDLASKGLVGPSLGTLTNCLPARERSSHLREESQHKIARGGGFRPFASRIFYEWSGSS